MSRRRAIFCGGFLCVLAVMVGLPAIVPAQQDGELRRLAIPRDVAIVVGSHLVVVTGPPAGESSLQCSPGSRFQHNAVALDPGGAHAAQRTEIVIFDPFYGTQEPVRAGTRFRIEAGPDACNAQYDLFDARVE